MKLQKLGGYASILIILGGIASALILIPLFRGIRGLDIFDPAKMIAAYQASPILFETVYFLEMLSGILFLLVTLALQERMQSKAPNLMRLAVIAASISAALLLTSSMCGVFRNAVVVATRDVSAYRAFLLFFECLVSAAHHAGGWGLLLIGWASLRTRALPRILGCIIFVNGIAAVIQVAITQLETACNLLGLVSMLWLGIVLLRKPEPGLG